MEKEDQYCVYENDEDTYQDDQLEQSHMFSQYNSNTMHEISTSNRYNSDIMSAEMAHKT